MVVRILVATRMPQVPPLRAISRGYRAKKQWSFAAGGLGPRRAPTAVMARALDMKNDAHITSPCDSTPLRARCAEPEGDPTEVIPGPLLLRLLAETAQDKSMDGGVPRFELVEIEPEDVILDVDDSAFENAFREMLGANAAPEGA